MEHLTWSIQTSPPGVYPMIVSDYVLNDLGVFYKREKRMPKKAAFTAVTGFRVGYHAIEGTDYRAAPLNRNALMWYKVTSVSENGENRLRMYGNRSDVIDVFFTPENKSAVLDYVAKMRAAHPVQTQADYTAAAWLCWRDDDEWEDPRASLTDMIVRETQTRRMIEPEVLEETVLTGNGQGAADRPKFCASCGSELPPDGCFCENCGTRIPL